MTSQPAREPRGRHGLRVLPLFATLAVAGLVSAAAIAPSTTMSSSAAAVTSGAAVTQDVGGLAGLASIAGAREHFTSEAAPPPPPPVQVRTAPAAGIPDPGTARAIGLQMTLDRGWPASEFDCLAALWDRESRWDVYAFNASSGAYGIPQALPGDKMASHGADWQTNPATQISWGLSYIGGRYGSPCGAWDFSNRNGWY
ncbi:MAG TPA: lytic transglycosylase domain-containing protein [Microbacteriaceae bacterium]|nr:lytic transglycosylase domain-containing protein [Microbacteriaceae bacterium]